MKKHWFFNTSIAECDGGKTFLCSRSPYSGLDQFSTYLSVMYFKYIFPNILHDCYFNTCSSFSIKIVVDILVQPSYHIIRSADSIYTALEAFLNNMNSKNRRCSNSGHAKIVMTYWNFLTCLVCTLVYAKKLSCMGWNISRVWFKTNVALPWYPEQTFLT